MAPICPACNGNACKPLELVDVVVQHRDYAPEEPGTQRALNAAAAETALRYQLFRCNHCGLEFSDPMCPPSSEWYHLAYRALDLFPSDRWEFNEVLRRIPEGEHIFEFGCGSGAFLERCKQAGVPSSGMDFSADAVASCTAKGLDVSWIDLNSMSGAAGSACFPQMAAFHFVEHIECPATLLALAAARAAPGAHLWLSVPSNLRPSRRMGLRDFLDQPPHHMTRWTPESFFEIGNLHGWRLTEMLYEPLPLRGALWSITAYSPRYQRWKEAGRFKKPLVEKAYRAGSLPMALVRWLLREQQMSGFSMLGHFVYKRAGSTET